MIFSTDLFEYAKARRSDPDTSHRAAMGNRDKDLRRVLDAHYRNPQGLNDFELARLVDRKQTSAGKRRGELRDQGLIEQSAERRPSDTGSPAIVWKITAKGIETARELIQEGSCAS